MPVLFLHGTDDPFVPCERSLRAVRDMPTDDVTVHIYEGARHEVLDETNRVEVIGHLGGWIDRVAPARGFAGSLQGQSVAVSMLVQVSLPGPPLPVSSPADPRRMSAPSWP